MYSLKSLVTAFSLPDRSKVIIVAAEESTGLPSTFAGCYLYFSAALIAALSKLLSPEDDLTVMS